MRSRARDRYRDRLVVGKHLASPGTERVDDERLVRSDPAAQERAYGSKYKQGFCPIAGSMTIPGSAGEPTDAYRARPRIQVLLDGADPLSAARRPSSSPSS